VDDHLKPTFDKPFRSSKRTWNGVVLHVDRFGNLITSFLIDDFSELKTRSFIMTVGTRQLDQFAATYAEIDPGDFRLIVGSSGYVEVATNQGSAARLTGCGPGAPCELTFY
jgi:S-adenosylmethionine hydrolase